MDRAEPLAVEVVYCPRPGLTEQVPLRLPPGATLLDALQASGLLERHGLAMGGLRAGIWCKVQEHGTLLREGDRVEIYRALRVDPKEARRQRYEQHKLRANARTKGRTSPA
jgi:putative ubiquitin-RnfH superfamily antitoxin RatB of RatAB toxin-antitoxin module